MALGDSYASGEGASDPDGGDDYYRETDINGHLDDDKGRNACHRSRFAWPREGVLADAPTESIGSRADTWDDAVDFQFHACSGAVTRNLLPEHSVPAGQPKPENAFGQQGRGQYGEVSQLDKGYLDSNTTLVTLSVGGNDARFADIIKECMIFAGPLGCPNATLPGETEELSVTVPRDIQNRVRDSVLITLRQTHERAPNARIVLMGYPRLFEGVGVLCSPGIDAFEALWLNDMADLLNQQLRLLSEDANQEGIPTDFANPTDQFQGKGICGDPEAIHRIVADFTDGDEQGPGKFSNQSFHPKISGATLYAQVLNEALRRIGM